MSRVGKRASWAADRPDRTIIGKGNGRADICASLVRAGAVCPLPDRAWVQFLALLPDAYLSSWREFVPGFIGGLYLNQRRPPGDDG